jgi:hypothetical protein
MGDNQLFLFKNYIEHVPKADLKEMVPELVRGIYVLFNEDNDKKMNVVYIGRSAIGSKQGIGARIVSHTKEKKAWSHFSVFEVWDNVSNMVVEELEALILHIYARDGSANGLNIQKNSKRFHSIRRADRNSWKYRS